jgi:hypothetical protein
MSTRLKVHGGTRSSSAPRLCDTCQSGIVRKGASESDERVHCLIMRQRIDQRVIECSRYVATNQTSIWDMRQIAWILDSDSKRQRIGFIRAKEWERKHENEELLPTHPE